MFQIRAVLAATLSSVYGIYSGFELCENAALTGREEYLDSEKYQLKERDWDAPGNIKPLITQLNRIRRENRALHFYDNLRFHPVDNEALLFYSKLTPARDSIVLVIVNLDPAYAQSGYVEVPIEQFGELFGATYEVHDLLTRERYVWHGKHNYVALHPGIQPAHILRVQRL
jgi:starch synthase (maltosyl-transferring)